MCDFEPGPCLPPPLCVCYFEPGPCLPPPRIVFYIYICICYQSLLLSFYLRSLSPSSHPRITSPIPHRERHLEIRYQVPTPCFRPRSFEEEDTREGWIGVVGGYVDEWEWVDVWMGGWVDARFWWKASTRCQKWYTVLPSWHFIAGSVLGASFPDLFFFKKKLYCLSGLFTALVGELKKWKDVVGFFVLFLCWEGTFKCTGFDAGQCFHDYYRYYWDGGNQMESRGKIRINKQPTK